MMVKKDLFKEIVCKAVAGILSYALIWKNNWNLYQSKKEKNKYLGLMGLELN